MRQEDIDKIEEKFAEVNYSGDPTEYVELIDYLKSFDSLYKNDSELEFYKGLAYYSNPIEDKFFIDAAFSHFVNAVSYNEKNFMAMLYIGQCYYDKEDFVKALKTFKSILSSPALLQPFQEEGLQWRLVNMAELIAACNLNLGRYHKFQNYYSSWKELYNVYIDKSKENFYFPKDLVLSTASFLRNRGDDIIDPRDISFFRSVSFDLIRLIKAGEGFAEIYEEEIEDLKNWDGQKLGGLMKVYK